MSLVSEPDYVLNQRRRMIDNQLRSRGIRDERILSAMAHVPRTEFVPPGLRDQAYEDHPIPLPKGQTISQPFIVALMLQAIAPQPSEVVLEIGTGSGYLTALLAELFNRVYSIERHLELAASAEHILVQLGYTNFEIISGDGTRGLPAHAPYDAIMVSAAAPQIPPALFVQLREGGRMIIPVGPSQAQQLQRVEKKEGLRLVESLEGCRFVPLVSDSEPGLI